MGKSYIDHAVYHEVPVAQHVLCEVSVVDQLVDDARAVLDAQSIQHLLCEVVPQKVGVSGHIVWGNVGVVYH